MRYHFIQEQRDAFSLAALCRAMQVSVSGYYAWLSRPASQRQQHNLALTEQITRVHQESKATYGSPRIYKELHEQGITCSAKRIARLMRLAGLHGTLPRRFVVTTHSDMALPIAENLLAREFTVQTPNARWTTDITYIWTQQGWLYLAVILDLFSRRIVGWAMGHTLERSLALAALDMALAALDMALADRRPCAGLLCHAWGVPLAVVDSSGEVNLGARGKETSQPFPNVSGYYFRAEGMALPLHRTLRNTTGLIPV